MDLGKKIDLAEPTKPKEPKLSYPSFSLNDKHAEEFHKDCPCEIGSEITFTGKMKVVGFRDDEWGKSISFDLVEIKDMTPAKKEASEKNEAASDSADADEEKTLGYKRPKKDAVKEEVKADSDFMD